MFVKANANFKKWTLLAEYVGEVISQEDRLQLDSDSVMDLLRHPSANRNLVIWPERLANISKFFSGINNYDDLAEKKKNVSSIKYRVGNDLHILLYASTGIKKGQILYYDYNSVFDDFPTDGFV